MFVFFAQVRLLGNDGFFFLLSCRCWEPSIVVFLRIASDFEKNMMQGKLVKVSPSFFEARAIGAGRQFYL